MQKIQLQKSRQMNSCIYLPQWRKEFLEQQYKEYIKDTPMTKKEQQALREWVKDGNSVFENPDGTWYDGQAPVEFLTVYRDNEYIRQHTKELGTKEARRFAMAYYGWDDKPAEENNSENSETAAWLNELPIRDELPFK